MKRSRRQQQQRSYTQKKTDGKERKNLHTWLLSSFSSLRLFLCGCLVTQITFEQFRWIPHEFSLSQCMNERKTTNRTATNFIDLGFCCASLLTYWANYISAWYHSTLEHVCRMISAYILYEYSVLISLLFADKMLDIVSTTPTSLLNPSGYNCCCRRRLRSMCNDRHSHMNHHRLCSSLIEQSWLNLLSKGRND